MDLGEGLPPGARLRAMAAVAIAVSMAVLDSAIANIALPTIARDMATTPAATIWVVNAYQFAVTVSLLPLAFLGDVMGYKRVYMGGLVVFTVAASDCTSTTSLTTDGLTDAVIRVVSVIRTCTPGNFVVAKPGAVTSTV